MPDTAGHRRRADRGCHRRLAPPARRRHE